MVDKTAHLFGPHIMTPKRADAVVVDAASLGEAERKIQPPRSLTIARKIAWSIAALLFVALVYLIISSWDGVHKSNFKRITQGLTTEMEVEAIFGSPTGSYKPLDATWWCGREAEIVVKWWSGREAEIIVYVEGGRVTRAFLNEFSPEPSFFEKIRKLIGF